MSGTVLGIDIPQQISIHGSPSLEVYSLFMKRDM